jgi:hypothetical protein
MGIASFRNSRSSILPAGDELNQNSQTLIDQLRRRVRNVPDDKLREASNDVVSPVGEIYDQSLEALIGQTSQLLVHVHRESGEQIDQLGASHAVGDQSGNGGNASPEQVNPRLPLSRDQLIWLLFIFLDCNSVGHS